MNNMIASADPGAASRTSHFTPHSSSSAAAAAALARQLRLQTSNIQSHSPPPEPVSPLDPAELSSLQNSAASHSHRRDASLLATDQSPPVSPLPVSRQHSPENLPEKAPKANSSQRSPPRAPQPKPQPTTPSRPQSSAMAMSPTVLSGLGALLKVQPPPSYVNQSGAIQVVAEQQAEQQLSEQLPTELAFSNGALRLINQFLDYVLYGCLANARSTSLTALRPAIQELLKQRLAREAIASAEEELRELLASNDEEDDVNGQQDAAESSSQWDLELVWKRTRLRVMVYSRLGEMEDEDEERYVEEDDLFHSDDRRFSRSTGLVSWAAAIFLTSILEYLAEQTLQAAGQAAFTRVRRHADAAHDSESPVTAAANSAVTVEEHDAEKVAMNATLGRLWRTWRKSSRTLTSSRSGTRSPLGRMNGTMSPIPSVGGDSVAHSRTMSEQTDRTASTVPAKTEPDGPEHTCVFPPHVSLPISDVARDIDEIEVPGLAKDPDAEEEEIATPTETGRRLSSYLPASVPYFGIRPGQGGEEYQGATKPSLVRKRSNSVPAPARSPFPQHEIPGAFPEEQEEHENDAQPEAEESLGKSDVILGGEEADVKDTAVHDPEPDTEEKSVAKDFATTPSDPTAHGDTVDETVKHTAEEHTVEEHTAEEHTAEEHTAEEHTAEEHTAEEPVLEGHTPVPPRQVGRKPLPDQTTVTGASSEKTPVRHRFDDSEVASATAAMAGVSATAAVLSEYSDRPERKPVSRPAATETPARNVEELDRVKSLAGIKSIPAPVPVEESEKFVEVPAIPPAREQTVTPSALAREETEVVSHSRSASEYSQSSMTRIDEPLRVQLQRESIDAGEKSPAKADSAFAEDKPQDEARDVPTPTRARSPPVSYMPSYMQAAAREATSQNYAKPSPLVTKPPALDTSMQQARAPPPPAVVVEHSAKPSNWSNSTVTTVTSVTRSPQTAPEEPPRKPLERASYSSIGSRAQGHHRVVSQIPEDAVVEAKRSGDSYGRSSKQQSGRSDADHDIPLASPSIRAPEDFDTFIQNSETVKYTLTPDTVRDDSHRDRMLLRKSGSIDRTDMKSRASGSITSTSPVAYAEPRTSRSSISRQQQNTAASPVPESPRSPRSMWSTKKDRRRSLPRPEIQNTTSSRKTGYTAREPRVQTESMRDFADFIRSTGPHREPMMSPAGSRSLSSLHSARNAQGKQDTVTQASIVNGTVPPVPGVPGRKPSFEPRSPTGGTSGNNDLVDFIRNGPAQEGQHRISRTVAPFRTTMDSDQFGELNDRVISTGPATNGNAVRPAVTKAVSADDSGKTRYRNKDPYAMDFMDDDDDDDLSNDLIAALPKNQQDSLLNFLNGSSLQNGTRPSTRESAATAATAPPMRSGSRSSRYSGYRARLEAESRNNTRDLISFLDAGPAKSDRPVTAVENARTKNKLAAVAEERTTSSRQQAPSAKPAKKGGFFSAFRRN